MYERNIVYDYNVDDNNMYDDLPPVVCQDTCWRALPGLSNIQSNKMLQPTCTIMHYHTDVF